MKLDLNRKLIETAVKRALRDMGSTPERSIRNLIDLGLTFAKGPTQQDFLRSIQAQLRDSASPYYALLRDILDHVDHGRLTTLGLNLGYNSCTRGAARIRAIEGERGFNIPWVLSLALSEAGLTHRKGRYLELLRQGTDLGIYSYALFPEGDPTAALELVRSQPDGVFFLFLREGQVTEDLLSALRPLKNVLAAVQAEEDMSSACALLRRERMPYALWQRFGGEGPLPLEAWLTSLLPAHPIFALLLPEADCPQAQRQAVYDQIRQVRTASPLPILPVDILRDALTVDEVISEDGCLVGFGPDGALYTHTGPCPDSTFNLLQNSLEDILVRVQALR